MPHISGKPLLTCDFDWISKYLLSDFRTSRGCREQPLVTALVTALQRAGTPARYPGRPPDGRAGTAADRRSRTPPRTRHVHARTVCDKRKVAETRRCPTIWRVPRSSVVSASAPAPPLGALLSRYAAGTPLACEPVDQGLLNRGYRLATTHGRYFLKHHFDPETADPAAIIRQHHATQRLADLGVPVAPPLTGTDGRTVAVIDGHAYALHPWIN